MRGAGPAVEVGGDRVSEARGVTLARVAGGGVSEGEAVDTAADGWQAALNKARRR